ncbi:hypothetical protein ACIOWG_08515 [Streptomyces sp. NPDC087658]|uniref:hypothetical protein n=1 Tax=Streptomyces sp. NPDC087658 TaxID=3365800 RepID=UPI003802CB80
MKACTPSLKVELAEAAPVDVDTAAIVSTQQLPQIPKKGALYALRSRAVIGLGGNVPRTEKDACSALARATTTESRTLSPGGYVTGPETWTQLLN